MHRVDNIWNNICIYRVTKLGTAGRSLIMVNNQYPTEGGVTLCKVGAQGGLKKTKVVNK